MADAPGLTTYDSICTELQAVLIKTIAEEIKRNAAIYYQQYGNTDGYTPTQSTIVFNSDGTISIFLKGKPFDFGAYCCTKSMPYIINTGKDKLNIFKNIDATSVYWDNDSQACKWKKTEDACAIDTFKIVLNPVDNDGALFNVDSDDKPCELTIDFNYLFKFDCQDFADILNPAVNTNVDPKVLDEIKQVQAAILEQEAYCEDIASKLEAIIKQYNLEKYSIVNCGSSTQIYCILEENGGLEKLQALIGPTKYKRFIDGEPDVLTCDDIAIFIDLSKQSTLQFNKPLLETCTTPYGSKSKLKKVIDEITLEKINCEEKLKVLNSELTTLNDSVTTTTQNCKTPIDALESFNASITLDVIESDGSLTTVKEYELFNSIGSNNLFTYLKAKQENSGFYFCGLPKATETWTTGCTELIAYELMAPTGLPNNEPNNNVSVCNTVKQSLLGGLLSQSALGTSPTEINEFNKLLNKNIFASNWLNYENTITDETVLAAIKNKKIKISIKINNTCTNVCVYIDNIKLIKDCVDGLGKTMLITQSPGFELDKVIDNKKSWLKNFTPVTREFQISNNEGLNVIRKTDYDVNDERLVINTKEIDLDINIASAIENDIQTYINDNPTILDSVPSYDCGCQLECFSDVFEIISHADAVASGDYTGYIYTDPEDYMILFRVKRDAWLKSWNELMLATAPYIDLKDALYYNYPSQDYMIVYEATKAAWTKALYEFNLASGGGYIEGLSEKPNLKIETEKLQPQMFNTKCGRILKINGNDGEIYLTETAGNQLKIYQSFYDFPNIWIDLSNLIEDETYPSDWGSPIYTPEKRVYFCKYFGSINNYVSNFQMVSYHYVTNNNTAHNEWINSVNNSLFIDWNSTENKCMTNMFKQVIPEEFSMYYPITDPSFSFYQTWFSPTCDADIWLRNSGGTACTSFGIDWTWPNISEDIATISRLHRNEAFKRHTEVFLSSNSPVFYLFIKDPLTNQPPDESSGTIPVHVTTTIRKDSRDGEIVFQEEYVLNDSTSPCQYRDDVAGLNKLEVYVGITDPNSAYWNSNAYVWDFIDYCSTSEFGTYITGSTSGLPLAGASDNATDRNWEFDVNYYVHFDVENNNTGQVYHVMNNDFNLKDRHLPVKCPSSASTQTFNITTALNSINTFKNNILGQIQEDLDYALNNCTDC